MRKFIPYICLLGVIIVITISILFNKSKEVDNFLYYYNSYNLTSLINEEDYLSVDLYVNNKKSYFVDYRQISSCFVESEEGSVDLDIKGIYDNNQSIIYNGEEYYNYKFRFKITFDTSNYTSWFLKNVKLVIRYNNDIEYNLKIGDISINKLEENNEIIALSNIKPLTSIIKNNTYLTGLIIGIRKTTNKNVKLNKIKLLDANLSIGNKIETLKELPTTNHFDDIANYDYSSIVKGDEEVGIKILEDTLFLFVPIYYEEMTISNKFPICLELLIDENIENYILSDYIFYEPSNYIINEEKIVICEIK